MKVIQMLEENKKHNNNSTTVPRTIACSKDFKLVNK